jgi:hypothetical protein
MLFAMMTLLGAHLALAATAPTADDMARCAAITAPDARLGCYDQLAHRAPDRVPLATVTAKPARPAVASSAAVAPAAPVGPAPAEDPNGPQNFGLSPVQRHVEVAGPKSQTAQIVDVYAEANGHAVIKLDNGQSWSVLDDDGRVPSKGEVTIKRASLGSFLLWTKEHHSYRVKRLR